MMQKDPRVKVFFNIREFFWNLSHNYNFVHP